MAQLGLTQEQLAERLNDALREITGRPGDTSARAVRNLLNGSSRRPIGRTCAALERVFGCSVEDLGRPWRSLIVASRSTACAKKTSASRSPASAYGRDSAIASSTRPQPSNSSARARAAGHQFVAMYGASTSNASSRRPRWPSSRAHSSAQNHSPRPAWNSTSRSWPSSRSRDTSSGGMQPVSVRVRQSRSAASTTAHLSPLHLHGPHVGAIACEGRRQKTMVT
ncbi:helix-turn-helix transcriptional regulator [Streptomyces sp. ID05-18]|nr:helix-turn-helix transcriptional regulator [Streptomyces sp. ID05-18]